MKYRLDFYFRAGTSEKEKEEFIINLSNKMHETNNCIRDFAVRVIDNKSIRTLNRMVNK